MKPDKPNDVYLRGPGFENTYASTNQGQVKFCGVTKGGKEEFKRLVDVCIEARAKEETHTFEQAFLKGYQQRNNIIAATAEENRKAKRRKRNDEIAEESDEEDDAGSLAEESDDGSIEDDITGSNDEEEEEEEDGDEE